MGFFIRIGDFAAVLDFDSLNQTPLPLPHSTGKPTEMAHPRCVNSSQTRNCWIEVSISILVKNTKFRQMCPGSMTSHFRIRLLLLTDICSTGLSTMVRSFMVELIPYLGDFWRSREAAELEDFGQKRYYGFILRFMSDQ
jgi:hypothetical protein